MKALVYTGPREMVYRDEADPALGRGGGGHPRSMRSASAARTCTPITATIRAGFRR